jgi:hypothetical protein
LMTDRLNSGQSFEGEVRKINPGASLDMLLRYPRLRELYDLISSALSITVGCESRDWQANHSRIVGWPLLPEPGYISAVAPFVDLRKQAHCAKASLRKGQRSTGIANRQNMLHYGLIESKYGRFSPATLELHRSPLESPGLAFETTITSPFFHELGRYKHSVSAIIVFSILSRPMTARTCCREP